MQNLGFDVNKIHITNFNNWARYIGSIDKTGRI